MASRIVVQTVSDQLTARVFVINSDGIDSGGENILVADQITIHDLKLLLEDIEHAIRAVRQAQQNTPDSLRLRKHVLENELEEIQLKLQDNH